MKITFVDAIRIGIKKYVVFKGTASRPEFWYFVLFSVLLSIVLGTIDSILWPSPQLSDSATLEESLADFSEQNTPLSNLGNLFLVLPSLAITARRLHDAGFSGKWLFLLLIPVAYTIFAGIGFASMLTANNPNEIDLMLILFLVLPIVALSFLVGLVLLILNLMPTRSFFDGNKYAEPKPITEESSPSNFGA